MEQITLLLYNGLFDNLARNTDKQRKRHYDEEFARQLGIQRSNLKERKNEAKKAANDFVEKVQSQVSPERLKIFFETFQGWQVDDAPHDKDMTQLLLKTHCFFIKKISS